MATLASDLIDEVESDLLDDDNDRWSEADLINYLNAGERQLVFFKPTSYTDDTPFQLVEGIRQSLPSGGVELIDIRRNMGTDGSTPGASIFKIDPKDLDECVPDWRSATESATVVHFMFDPNDRKAFDVYPKQPSANQGYVEAVYSLVPATEISATSDNIHLDDEYKEPLKNYMKFRAYSVDAQLSQFAYQRALDAYNLFVTQIGRKDLVEKRLPAMRGKYGNSNSNVSQ